MIIENDKGTKKKLFYNIMITLVIPIGNVGDIYLSQFSKSDSAFTY